MRLRLKSSSSYSLGDLQWCMVHVPDHAHTVGDLASHVSRLLELDGHGGDGKLPQLLLDGYLVPHCEDVRQVLRDDEVLDVEPTSGPAVAGLGWPALALGGVGRHGERAAGLPRGAEEEQAPAAKKARRGSGGGQAQVVAAPMQAIGWQPPEALQAGVAVASAMAQERKGPAAAASAAKKKQQEAVAAKGSKLQPVPKAAPAPSSSSSSEEASEEPSAAKKVAGAALGRSSGRGGSFGGGRGRGQDIAADAAAATAQAAALATCGRAAIIAEREGSAGASNELDRSIYVRGFPPHVSPEMLKMHFERVGAVRDIKVPTKSDGSSKGFGFVEFADVESRAKAIAADGSQKLEGKTLEIKPRVAKGAGKGGKAEGKGVAHGGKHNAVGKKGGNTDKEPQESAPAALPLADEEVEMQRQMALLGLPVSFTATVGAGDEESDDEEGEEESDEEE